MLILLAFLVLESECFMLAIGPAHVRIPKAHYVKRQHRSLESFAMSEDIPHYHTSCSALFASSPGNEDALAAEVVSKEKSRIPMLNGTEKNSSAQSLLEKLDDVGLKLKPKYVVARDKALEVRKSDKLVSFLYTAKACSLIGLFIIYRAYRGFFVVLPAVFREVYKKLAVAVEMPFDPSIELKDQDVDPDTGKVRRRSRIVVSLLAGMVTASYVASGAFRVLMKFIRSIIATSSVEKSFEAAADEVMVNEKQIMKLATNKNTSGGTPTMPDESGSATLRP